MLIKYYGSSAPAPGEQPAQTTARVAAAGKSGRKAKVTSSDLGALLLKHDTAGTLLLTINLSAESQLLKEKKGIAITERGFDEQLVFHVFNVLQKPDVSSFESIFHRTRASAMEEKRRMEEEQAREAQAMRSNPSDSIAEAIQNSVVQPLNGRPDARQRLNSNANRPTKIVLRISNLGESGASGGAGAESDSDGITPASPLSFSDDDNPVPRLRKDPKAVRFLDPDESDRTGKVAIGAHTKKFDITFKGSRPVETKIGIHTVVRAYPEVDAKGKAATLVIDEDQVAIVDKNDSKLFRALRGTVTYWCIHPYNKKVLGFITCPNQGEPMCHVVQVESKARRIASAFVLSQPPPKDVAAAMGKDVLEAGMESMSKIAWSMQDTQEDKKLRNEDNATNSGFCTTFTSAYLGTLEISGDVRLDGVHQWLQTLASSTPALVRTHLKVFWHGVSGCLQVVDANTNELYAQEPILSLRFIGVVTEPTVLKLFKGQTAGREWERPLLALTSHDRAEGKYFLHCFRPEGDADEMLAAIGAHVADLQAGRKGLQENPFAPTSRDRHTTPAIFQNKRILRDTLVTERIIGTGQFGAVFLVRLKEPNKSKPLQWFAVKTIRPKVVETNEVDFLYEAEIMSRFSHPNLVKFMGVDVEYTPWLVVLEYMQYGDLQQVSKSCKEKGFTPTYLERLKLIVQISRAMKYLADQRYVHMDLAARNCLLGGNNRVKICDFGLTVNLEDEDDFIKLKSAHKMPLKWMCIESMFQGIFTTKSDVWSFAVVVWELFNYGDVPYGELKGRELQDKVKDGLRLMPSPDTPMEVQELCTECWNKEWKMRRDFGVITGRLEGFIRRERELADKPLRDIGKCLNGIGKSREVYMVTNDNEEQLFRINTFN